MVLAASILAAGMLPNCACEEEGGLARAEKEMILTFLEPDSCSANVVQRRIPDDYESGLVAATDFGSRGERVFEIRATGEINLEIEKIALSSEDPEFTLQVADAEGMPVTFPVQLRPISRDSDPAGLVVTVTYAAADAEPDLVNLVIDSDDPDREHVEFALSAGRGRLEVCVGDNCGEGVAVDFGAISRGQSATETVTLRNVGEGDLDLRAITLESLSGEFCAPAATELPEGTLDCNQVARCMTLRPGETYAVDVTYAPVDGDADTGELIIVSGDAVAGNVIVPINGQGAGPGLCVCIPEGEDCIPSGLLDFGLADVGVPVEKPVRLVSCGTEPVDLTEAVLEMDANNPFATGPEFAITQPISPGRLDPGQYAEGRISYTPTAPGRHRGGLRYGFAQSQLDSWVALVGQAATCDLVTLPPRIVFGTVAGGQSSDRKLVLQNVGAKVCTVSTLEAPEAPFILVAPPSVPFTVDPGNTVELDVRFAPPAGPVQVFEDSITVVSDEPGPGASNEVELHGEGGGTPVCEVEVAPGGGSPISMRDGTLNFGAVNIGYTTTLPIRIRNVGNAACTLVNYSLESLRGQSEFSVSTASPTPVTIGPGTIQEISVAFSPMNASDLPYTSLANSVDFTLAGPGLAQADWSIGILARATVPAIDVLPRDVDFGVITWDRPQAPDNRSSCGSEVRRLSVYNSGSGPLNITSISIDPSSDSVFLVDGVSQGGSTLSPPYAATVPGGGNVEVSLRFYPSRANPASHRGLLVIDNDVTNPQNNGAPLTVPLEGEGTTNASQVDRFTQLRDNQIDILWVVDDSGSMSEEQSALSQNFQSFINFADGLGVDYQVGVITTEVRDQNTAGIIWACNGFNSIIRHTDANRVQAFQCAARVTNPPNGNSRPNPGGSDSQEAGLQAARIALDVPNVNGANNGFLRPDARLAVIIVSDEDDQSNGPVNLYVDFFRNLKGFRNPQLVSVSAIAGDVPGGCSTAAAGTRYSAAASALNGQFESVCSNSWNRMLQNIGLGVFALRSSWTLSRQADPATIRVTVNGTSVSQSGTSGWTYDAGSNSINFHGAAVPAVGTQIEVSYGAICLP